MIRPKGELTQVALHVLGRHVNMRRGDGLLEQPPERFHAIDMVRHTCPMAMLGKLLRAVLDPAMPIPVLGQ